ncbi:MAG: class II aldolase/adducin family protein [Treponema sp.]|jgi:rhamnose utilization protein RhaD (predicted bifunctional aldolase and dehydrogenase)|nr:class II aldolase/adducin family protein [Treponema sp.]
MSLETLSALSRRYGADRNYVIAGGGNTSFKDRDTIWIKGSGVSLAEITPEGFVAMDRAKLAALWDLAETGTGAEREAAVLAGMLAARCPGEEHKRPSVETLLHDLLPAPYVVHTHPSLVNGLTCSRDGEAAMTALFGEEPLWIPLSDPGFVLANTVRRRIAERGRTPPLIFLQNHGIFVSAGAPEEIVSLYGRIMDAIDSRIRRRPLVEDSDGALPAETAAAVREATAALRDVSGGSVRFARSGDIMRFVESRAAFAPVSSAFTPDHIVYAGSDPLFIEDSSGIAASWKTHTEQKGRPPKIAALRGLGVFGLGPTDKAAALALELFNDTVKVAVYAESFGGYRFMTAEKIDFINNWEAEQYRARQVN